MTTERKQKDRPDGLPGLLEALVGLSILVSLSGVVMPLVGSSIRGDLQTQALSDMQHIVDGLRAYQSTTLFLPTGVQGRTNVAWLHGPGDLPAGNTFAAGGDGQPLQDVLLDDAMAGSRWQGPYVDGLHPDPWGHAYLLNVEGLVDGREPPVVLSAGPNGIVDTPAGSAVAQGDDILLPIN